MRVNGSGVDEVNYCIPWSNGALTPKHVKKIGPAWALFLHYEDRVTTGMGTNGFVLGGKETTDEEPAKRLGYDLTTIGRHRRRLEKHGYIRTELTRKGYKITVRKSKKWIQIQVGQGKVALREGKSASQQGKDALRQGKSVRPGPSAPINDQSLTYQGHLPAEWKAFWTSYPKKKNKPAAERAWKQIKLAEVPAIMACIEVNRNTHDWTKQKRQYCPYPASFLNGRRWEDEPTEVNEKRGTHGTDTRRKANERGGAGCPSRFRGVERPASEFAQPTH